MTNLPVASIVFALDLIVPPAAMRAMRPRSIRMSLGAVAALPFPSTMRAFLITSGGATGGAYVIGHPMRRTAPDGDLRRSPSLEM